MQTELTDVITSEEQLREIIGHPSERNIQKVIPILDEHCRMFIARSPFMLLASTDVHGRLDVSPKGDPPGFVQVLDDKTLVIPDRPGNRRADSLTNMLHNPQVGLLFMIPGKRETLRVSGNARIARDEWLRERMAVRGKVPELAIVVTVETAFMHCAKCLIRSQLWEPEHWPDFSDLSSLARVLIDHANLTCTVDEFQEIIDDSYQNHLY
ncbi:MAG: pyridoxamine 5'-phosphate oxidase family protein [Anaerolineae bacterium]|nr:pyridoxamine 5'-phosphate oxidase family protein [Anaerolineae bacterium]